MDSTVLQPMPGQTVVTTEDGHRGHHGHGHHGREEWAQAILREQAAGFRTAALDRTGLGTEITTGATAGALAACKTQDAIGAVGTATQLAACHTDQLIANVAKDNALGFKDLTALGYQVEGRALLEAAKNEHALAVQATANANAAAVQAVQNYNALNVQAEKLAAAAALAAEKCCCELKERIAAEGAKTRDLIQSNLVADLQARLVATQRLIPVTVPVGA